MNGQIDNDREIQAAVEECRTDQENSANSNPIFCDQLDYYLNYRLFEEVGPLPTTWSTPIEIANLSDLTRRFATSADRIGRNNGFIDSNWEATLAIARCFNVYSLNSTHGDRTCYDLYDNFYQAVTPATHSSLNVQVTSLIEPYQTFARQGDLNHDGRINSEQEALETVATCYTTEGVDQATCIELDNALGGQDLVTIIDEDAAGEAAEAAYQQRVTETISNLPRFITELDNAVGSEAQLNAARNLEAAVRLTDARPATRTVLRALEQTIASLTTSNFEHSLSQLVSALNELEAEAAGVRETAEQLGPERALAQMQLIRNQQIIISLILIRSNDEQALAAVPVLNRALRSRHSNIRDLVLFGLFEVPLGTNVSNQLFSRLRPALDIIAGQGNQVTARGNGQNLASFLAEVHLLRIHQEQTINSQNPEEPSEYVIHYPYDRSTLLRNPVYQSYFATQSLVESSRPFLALDNIIRETAEDIMTPKLTLTEQQLLTTLLNILIYSRDTRAIRFLARMSDSLPIQFRQEQAMFQDAINLIQSGDIGSSSATVGSVPHPYYQRSEHRRPFILPLPDDLLFDLVIPNNDPQIVEAMRNSRFRLSEESPESATTGE